MSGFLCFVVKQRYIKNLCDPKLLHLLPDFEKLMINRFFTLLIFCQFLAAVTAKGQDLTTVSSVKNYAGYDTARNYNITPVIDSTVVLEPKRLYRTSFDSLYFTTGVDDSTSIYTYRGSNQRNSPVRGWLDGRPSEITDSWIFTTGSDTANGDYGVWGGGAGWTGQPLVVKWTKEELRSVNDIEKGILGSDSSLTEIIQVSLAGKVYFIDFNTGKRTRKPLEINNPIKGTPAIDGPARRYLLVGQGIQNRDIFAWRVFDLRTSKLLHTEAMPSYFAYRGWGACDATPLIDPLTTGFFWPSESGILYRGYLRDKMLDSVEQYRYMIKAHPKVGTESSPSAFGYLGYITDNSGNILCIDLRSMKTRWYFFNTDDTDGSPVVSIRDSIPYIYVGHEVDLQGNKGEAHIRKLNGMTGKPEWTYTTDCYSLTKPRTDNGGMLCTPVAGVKNGSGLIWTIFSRTTAYGGGSFVCLNDSDGSLRYEIKLKAYSWVSPIALYDRDGNPYIYFSDVVGNIFLIDGLTGEIIYKRNLNYIFESSPVAVGNRIIQPARGNRILSFTIK